MMAGMEILVVDDDEDVRESLRRSLEFEGYDVRTAGDGERALAAIAERAPDAVVLDLQLPGIDGLAACRRLRSTGHDLPILMLTARDGTSDRVTGLDAGADDYLPKPFALEELLARLRAVLRRRAAPGSADRGADAARTDRLAYGDLLLDRQTREVSRDGHPIELTRTEYALLELFLSHPRAVLTRAQILREVWGYDFDPGSNTLDVYVGYLRRKTEERGAGRLLHNVRGVGYTLRSAAGAPPS
jgi:two-component system, OmpR family, response regulator MprA